MVLTSTVRAMAGPPTSIDWTLTPGTPKLTTRFFSVQISGVGTGLFAVQPPKVRVEIHVKGSCVSQPASASYGFEDATREVHLRALADDTKVIDLNTVTVMLVDEIAEKAVRVHLLDATSGAELARLDWIEVALAF
jgi:hypothetical protein